MSPPAAKIPLPYLLKVLVVVAEKAGILVGLFQSADQGLAVVQGTSSLLAIKAILWPKAIIPKASLPNQLVVEAEPEGQLLLLVNLKMLHSVVQVGPVALEETFRSTSMVQLQPVKC